MATEEQAREIKNRHSLRLLQQPDDPAVQAGLPTEIEGCPVRFIHSGPFRKAFYDISRP
jgi:hypothetical protein